MRSIGKRGVKIGVKYCGNCNPHLEGPALVRELQQLEPTLTFTSYQDEEMKILLVVSGCPSDCASRPVFQGPTIVVGGYNLDYEEVEASRLVELLRQKILMVTRHYT